MKQTIRDEQRVVSHDIDELALQVKPIYEALPPVEPLPDIVDML